MSFHSLLTPTFLALAASVIPLHAQLLLTEIQSDGQSDFWELTNVGAAAVDIGNYKWDDESRNASDPAAVTIPEGTMINSGESIIFTATAAATFRTQWSLPGSVQVVLGGPGLGGNDGIALFNASGTELFFFTYGANGFTRSDGSASIGGHAGISAGGATAQALIVDPTYPASSPRYTFADGTNLGTFTGGTAANKGSPGYSGFGAAPPSVTLSLSATATTFAESAANPASTGTVTRAPAAASDQVVNLSSSDGTEATVPATVTILANETSASFPITAVDDTFPDGSKNVIITAFAVDATSGTVALTVTDDADVLDTAFLLTEMQSAQSPGSPSGSEDYWELTNISGVSRDIGGFSWHDSGRSGSAAAAYKLPAGTMIAPGESVIFTVMPEADFRAWWNLSPSVQVFQSVGAPGTGKGDGISFFDPGQNELFFFSYGVGGFTREDGSPSVSENPLNPTDVNDPGHAGIAAGGTEEFQAVVWVPTSGTSSPRYTAATGSNYGSFTAAIGLDLGSPGITDGVPSVSIASAAIAEGNSGTSTLTLNVTRNELSSAFSVDYAVTGGTADGADFSLAAGTLNFTAAGSATLPINITVNGDTDSEPDETVIVTLSNIVNTTGTTVLGNAVGTGTILTDDTILPQITTQPASTSITSGGVATLSLAATGSPAPTIQWYQGTSGNTSTPVGTNSNILTTPALTADTSYWARVTNGGIPVDSDTATVTIVAGVVGVDLSTYVRTGRYGLPEWRRTPLPPGTATHNLLCDEASAVTYNWDTDTLFISCDGGRSITQVSKTGQLIDTMSLDLLAGAPQGTAFYDPEGITYIGGGQFVISEERDRQIVKFTYAAGTTLTRANSQTVDLGTFDDNTGTEGLSWDPLTNGFIVLKEKSPIGVFQTNVDFAAGTATNGSPTTVNSINLFDTTLLGLTDVADVFTFSNIPSMAGQPQEGNLLIVGQEDARILNVTRSGAIQGSLNIAADAGDLISSPNMQHEGITMDRVGNIYVVNENGGGSIEFPELWVYSVSTLPNMAPTAIALNNAVTSLQENSSTASPVKVADIAVTDDGLGINALALTGADALFFEITGNALFIKAGVALDFETKPSYSVTVTVDDTTLGGTPDATVNYILTVTDQVVEIAAAPALLITEVAPWSSGNSPGVAADWFEVTNVSSNPVTVTGWKVDDNSNSFASARDLAGITTIAPGESVIFVESTTTTQATIVDDFKTTWFGASPPAGLQIGTYTGSGIGLGTGGDALNLFNAVGALQANVAFGVSDAASPYQTFDNTAALNGTAISQLSVLGVNGAFVAANSATEIGSPGYSAPPVLRVTEVAPWSSGNSPVAADWFEVTNIGARAADITGWLVDDNSESAAAAGPITGVTSIAPGESVILIDSANLETARTTFLNNWFGADPPANLQIGAYTGAGGLGTGGDAVNLFDTASPRVRQVNFAFGSSPGAAPYTTFDNAAGLNVATGTTFSAVGVNGAFVAANSPNEVGSPGTIVDFRLQLLHLADAEAGLLASQTAPNLAALVDAFDGTYPNTLILAGGDNFIPGPFLSAGTDPLVGATHSRGTNPAAADIEIHNRLGVEASTIGNHEFDLGTNAFSDAILDTTFPYLSANLNFAGDSGISGRYQETVGVGALEEASTLAQKIVPSAVVTKNGQKIGLVGATTQIVESISSTGGVEVKGFAGDGSEVDNMVLLASQIQPVIDDLKAQGVNKIVLMAHLQQIANEQTLAPLLTDVDIILAAGSNTRLGDGTDVPVAFAGHAANFAGNYPIYTTGADGKPTVIVNTDNEFTYLGRLVADFDSNGNIIVPNLAARTAINGAYAATAANVAAAWGVSEANLAATAFAPGTKGAGVKQITDAVQGVINAKDGDVRGFTNVYLEGERNFVRNQETNLGNISADSMITVGETALPANKFVAALKNGGGIRAQIGAVDVVSGAKLPPLANPAAGKPAGGISLLDIENSMRFNNGLMLCDTTPAGLKAILEHGVFNAGTSNGRFPQIGGLRFSYDPALTAGSRVRSIVMIDQDENITGRVVENGVVVPEAPPVITLVTLNFLAQGGDGYPFKANADNFRFLLDNGTLSAAIDESLDFAGAAVVPANLLREQAALSSHLTSFHATPAAAYDLADTAPALDTRIQSLSSRTDAVALGPVTLDVWLADNGFANGNGDSDNDTLIELLEFAFGLNPNLGDNGPNVTDVINGILVTRGTPAIYSAATANGQDFRVVFVRRKNPASVGLIYTPQFSSDMTVWETSTAIPTVIASDGDMEAVSIPYPFFVNGKKAKFFRVGVSQN